MSYLDEISERYGTDYIREFRSLIEEYSPIGCRFIEWGSGETTRAICEIARDRQNPFVLSIDDNREYQDHVAEAIPHYPFLHFRCLDLQGPSLSQSDEYPAYSSYPFLLRLRFDVAYIDGRRRLECALVASQIVNREGIVILHDWRRLRYAPLLQLFEIVHKGTQFLVLRPKQVENETPQAASESRVIIIPAKGKRSIRELEISMSLTQHYATSIGADLRVIGNDASALPIRLKGEAYDIAKDYDRCLLLDADVLIRPGSPNLFDIVPEDSIGAFVEGQFFSRDDVCLELTSIYDLHGSLQSSEYFNTGVLVLSRINVGILQDLKSEMIWGHPQFEQGFLNVQRIRRGYKLFPLTIDFNYIPHPPNSIDWRFAFFYHLAGSSKWGCNYNELWSDQSGNLQTFQKKPLRLADLRAGQMRHLAAAMVGRVEVVIDPTDFHYRRGRAMPIYTHDVDICIFFPYQNDADIHLPSVWGPYVSLQAGRWKVSFLGVQNEAFLYPGASYDVCAFGNAATILVERSSWPDDGVFEFTINQDVTMLEVRIYRAHGNHFGLTQVCLEWIGPSRCN